jgi:hypothetical protein
VAPVAALDPINGRLYRLDKIKSREEPSMTSCFMTFCFMTSAFMTVLVDAPVELGA